MSQKRFRVALVGCGRIAHVHAGYLKQTPNAEFVGACDLDVETRNRFASRWQVGTYADIDELIAATQPEFVHVVTPPATHAKITVGLLARGIGVMVEKPMAVTLEDVDQMIDAARASGSILTVDHNRWFDPVVRSAVTAIERGEIGEVVGVEVFQGVMAGEGQGTEGQQIQWSAALPGGALFDSAPHPAYLLRGFLGPIRELSVVSDTTDRDGIRELRAIARGDRVLGTLAISQGARPFTNSVKVLGSEATLEINLNNMTMVRRQTRQVPKLVGKVLPNLDEAFQLVVATVRNTIEFVTGKQRFYPGMGVHFRTLYANLAAGLPPPVSLEEARDVVALVDDLWRASGISGERKAA